jgi:replicative DNA helicase
MQADITLEKSLPHSVDAERAVLGSVLIDNRLYDQAAEILAPDDFYLDSHRKIYARMEELSGARRAIDSITLADELKRANELETVGGLSFIAALMDGVPRVSNLEHYARIVKEKALARQLIHSSHEILVRSFAEEEDTGQLLELAEKRIFDISQERVRSGFVSLQKLLDSTWTHVQSVYSRKELVTGIPSGFEELDRLTSGFQPSDLIIVAARPGLGKTSFALNVGQHAALNDKSVGIFSLEMAAQQLVIRLLCSEARVDSHRVRTGHLSHQDWHELAAAVNRLDQAKLFIDDTPAISIVEMRSKARRLKVEHGLDLLIVDYLQLMSASSGPRVRFENRQQEISAISRSLKGLAKELHIPLIAVSQLSRAPEQRRGDHKPQLSDLRESGSIEQDADVVLFIYRGDLYKDQEVPENKKGVAQIIIGKQRNGPTDVVELAFISQWTRFDNLSKRVE